MLINDLGISKIQYQNLIMAAESIDRLTKAMPFRKFRPLLKDYKGHYKEWLVLYPSYKYVFFLLLVFFPIIWFNYVYIKQ